MELTPQQKAEQELVDGVRIYLTPSPHLAGEEIAGVMNAARWAFRAGLGNRYNDQVQPERAIASAFRGHGPVAERTYDRVMVNPEYTAQIMSAFMQGLTIRLELIPMAA